MTEEIHPWTLYAPHECTTLIVGTFPPLRRNWSFDFFYPNKTNLFWRVMAEIAGRPLTHHTGEAAVVERKSILAQLKVALTDMGKKIVRTENSSADETLRAVEYMDIFDILDRQPSLRKIIFTSSSGKTSAAGWFNNYLQQRNINHKFPNGERPLHSALVHRDRKIELVVLYSPSARAANRISLPKLTELYRNELTTDN